MERMWSPWRAQHLGYSDTDDPASESIFSRMARAACDEDNLILWRGDEVFVLLNRYPYNNGHLMIVPYREVQHYEDLTRSEQVEMAQTIERCIRWLRQALSPDGFNVGMNLGVAGGAGIPVHLHMHVVPRWKGDTNFMPAVGQVKVIPEALSDTYARLRAAVEAAAATSRRT